MATLSSKESYHSDFPSLNGFSLEAQDFDLKQKIEDVAVVLKEAGVGGRSWLGLEGVGGGGWVLRVRAVNDTTYN